MNFLAVDTSSQKLSFSISKNSNLIYEYSKVLPRGSSRLICQLQKAFRELALGVKDFDFFVVGSGPGSFTGLRISFSVIKAFSLAANKPVFSCDSFFSCAYSFLGKEKKVAVIADAKKNLIYAAFFLLEKNKIKQIVKPSLMNLEDCLRRKKDYFFVTYDYHLRQKIIDLGGRLRICPKDIYPQAKYLIYGLDKSKITKATYNLDTLKPLYLHPMSCQVRKK